MKPTRKQKLRKKQDKRQRVEDSKFALLERLLHLVGVSELLPMFSADKVGAAALIAPGIDVVVSGCSRDDLIADDLRCEFERAIEDPFPVGPDGQEVEVSLNELLRGYPPLVQLISVACAYANDSRHSVSKPLATPFAAAASKIVEFENSHLVEAFDVLLWPLNVIANEVYRIDESVPWYRIERNERYPHRFAHRIVVGRKKPVPVSLPVADGRRKAYVCERTDGPEGLHKLTWNPKKLGIGDADRELPVFISQHAISRLHERVPMAPYFNALHTMMYQALERARLRPAENRPGFLVEAGTEGSKVGYFLVDVYDDFVFVRTFLFLTMQGTPEAKCLRKKLGLSRSDIEYYKLDHFFTLSTSDIGSDPDLRRALAECKCDHLLDLAGPQQRLSWLTRYREPLRRELGLPFLTSGDGRPDTSAPASAEVAQIIEQSQDFLKRCEGWIV